MKTKTTKAPAKEIIGVYNSAGHCLGTLPKQPPTSSFYLALRLYALTQVDRVAFTVLLPGGRPAPDISPQDLPARVQYAAHLVKTANGNPWQQL